MRPTTPAGERTRCDYPVASRAALPGPDFEAPAWRRSSRRDRVSSETARVLLGATVLLSALLPACPAIVSSGEPPATRGAQAGKWLSTPPRGNSGGAWGSGFRGVAGHSRHVADSFRGLRGGGFWIWGNKEENRTEGDDAPDAEQNASTAPGINTAEESQLLSQMLADAIVMGASPGRTNEKEDPLLRHVKVDTATRTTTTKILSGAPSPRPPPKAVQTSDSGNAVFDESDTCDTAPEDDQGGEATPLIECLVVEPTEQHTATIIWLHGYGDEAEYFAALPEALSVPWCKFVFPKAPLSQVQSSRQGGESVQLRSWFGHAPEDLRAVDGPAALDPDAKDSLEAAARAILRLVEEEKRRGVPSKRILLAGFAQGGVVAMHAALAARERLGGLALLSSWSPKDTPPKPSKASYRLRALICHGRGDPLVPVRLAKEAFQSLLSWGVQAEFREYALMAHDFCPPELTDVKHFLLSQAPRVERLITTKSNPAAREGWCRRRGDGGIPKMRSWLARYLVLRDNVLLLYHSDPSAGGDSRALEDKDLDWTEAVASDKKEAGCSIELRDQNDQGVASGFYHFESRSERDQWMDAIALSQKWQKEESERHQLVTLANAPPQARGMKPSESAYPRPPPPIWLGPLRTPGPVRLARREAPADPRPLPPPRRAIWENLVFSGGGIKVLAFPAALAAIADYYGEQGRNLRWVKRVAGVSGGTIIATAIACGCSVDDIMDTAKVFDLMEIHETMQNAGTLQTMRRLLSSYGVMDGNVLAHKVEQMIYTHTGLEGATFQQLYDHTGILLKIFATSLRNGQLFEFSALRTPNDQVAMAARCSMAVPFLFDAVPTSEGDLLVDGAMIDNCPVGCFDNVCEEEQAGLGATAREGVAGAGAAPIRAGKAPGGGIGGAVRANAKTLAFWIAARSSPQQAAPRSVRAFCLRLVDLVLFMQQKQQKSFFHGDERVVWVQSPDIAISTFKIDQAEEQLLLRCGRNSARHFMHHPGEQSPYAAEWEQTPSPPHRGLFHLLTRAVGAAENTLFDKWNREKQQESAIDRFVRYWLSVRQRSQALLPALEKSSVEGGAADGARTPTPNRLSHRA